MPVLCFGATKVGFTMSDTASNDGKSKMISLKGKSSTVRQSFSHGRSKSVVVETKRKRLFVPQNSDTNSSKPSMTKESSEETRLDTELTDNRKKIR